MAVSTEESFSLLIFRERLHPPVDRLVSIKLPLRTCYKVVCWSLKHRASMMTILTLTL